MDRKYVAEVRRTQSLFENPAQLCHQFYNFTNGQSTMTKAQFIHATGCKSEIFGSRLFETLDTNNSGDITVEELLEGLSRLRSTDTEERICFVFSIFDLDGDGRIGKEELKVILRASVEETDSEMTEEETSHLVSALLQLFDTDGSNDIQLEEFSHVLRNYPDLLSGMTFGTFGTTPSSASLQYKPEKKNFRWVRKTTSWIINNPQCLFTYTSVILVLLGCFLWRFFKYAGDCDGVDMYEKDPLTGYSRSDMMEMMETHDNFSVNKDDMNYMVFSKKMAEKDPIECQDARKRKLFSWTLPIAKGCGQAMKATFTLILFPVSRNLMTTLRGTFLKHIFLFDGAIEFHRFLGKVGFWLAWVHTICHVVDVLNWRDPNRFKYWSWAFPDGRDVSEIEGMQRNDSGEPLYDEDDKQMLPDGTNKDGFPSMMLNAEDQPNLQDILCSAVAVTGIVLISIYTIAALFAFDYPKKFKTFQAKESDTQNGVSFTRRIILKIGRSLNDFNNFWYSHHLFSIFYIALLFHPLPALPDEHKEWGVSDSWLWVGIPAMIYLVERALRVKRSTGRTRVVGADILPGNVVGLKVLRPRGFKYTPGQYVFIKCPQISRFEWHPFTLTSCPGDSYLGVHVRKAGDWTSALHNIVQNYQETKATSVEESGPSGTSCPKSTHIVKPVVGEELAVADRFPFTISVDGPFGAPAQNYTDYKVLVLIGAGIGVTPFASVLTDLLDSLRECACPRCGYSNTEQMRTPLRKVYFYWTVRSRSEASWFKHLLQAISLRDEDGLLDMNINITGIKGAKDLRTMMLSLAQYECGGESGSDVHSRAVTRFGRINWTTVFEKVKMEFPTEPNVGVFYCGPNTIAKSLNKLCRVHSRGPTKFTFMQESFG